MVVDGVLLASSLVSASIVVVRACVRACVDPAGDSGGRCARASGPFPEQERPGLGRSGERMAVRSREVVGVYSPFISHQSS